MKHIQIEDITVSQTTLQIQELEKANRDMASKVRIAEYESSHLTKRYATEQRKCKELRNMVDKMRYEYTKELQHLKDSVNIFCLIALKIFFRNENPREFQFTDAKYFDSLSTIMDEKTKFVVITKIEDVRKQYEDRIKQCSDKLEVFQRQVSMFERLCEDGNVLVTLDEMTAAHMLRKLAIVETDPKVIWTELQNTFGFGYFNPIPQIL